jgi:hypothetical protein
MTSYLNAAFVQTRQAALRREADEARLARIVRKTPEPPPIGVIKAALLSIRALTNRDVFGFADRLLRYDDRDRRPSGLQEDDDFRWRWTA